MTTITTRAGKGSPLTNNEMDANLTGLNDDKVEASGDSMTGNLSFGDNNKAIFGAGSDLQLYHDGSNSYISDQGTGNLVLQGSNLTLEATDGTNYIAADDGVSVFIYHPDATNQVKLSTTSTGIDVTGTVTADDAGFYQSSGTSQLRVGASASYNWNISRDNVSTGGLQIQSKDAGADVTRAFFALNGDISFYEDTGTTAKLTWDASAETLNFADNGKAVFGAGSDLSIFHDGSGSVIRDSGTGNLAIQAEDFAVQSSDASATHIFVDASSGYTALNYGGSTKLNTSSTGIDVTGTIVGDGLDLTVGTNDRTLLREFNSVNNLSSVNAVNSAFRPFEISALGTTISYGGTDTLITGNNTVNFYLNSGSISHGFQYNENGGELALYDDTGTAATLFDQSNNNTRLFELIDGSNIQVGLGGSNTTGALIFTKASGNEFGRITGSGYFGINNLNPDTTLHIGDIGATNATGQGRIKIEDTSGSLANDGGLEFVTSAFGSGYGWKVNSIDSSGVHLDFGTRQSSTTWANKIRFMADGRVAIGDTTTNNTANRLKVQGSQGDDRIAISTANTSSNASVEAQVANYWSGTTYTGTAIVQYDSAASGTTAGISNANLGMLRFQNGSAGLILTNGSQPIHFGTVGTTRMTLNASGNLVIGNSTPKTRLQVSGAGAANAPSLGSVSSNVPLYLTNADTAYGLVAGTNNSTGHAWLQAQRTDGTATAYPITLNEAGGNVGIGGSSFDSKLHVQGGSLGTTANDSLRIFESSYTSSNVDKLEFVARRLSNGSDWQTAAQSIQRKVDSTLMGYVRFGNNGSEPVSFGNGTTEYARFDNLGNLLVGTATTRTGNNSISLEPSNSLMYFRAAGTGSIQQAIFVRDTTGTPVSVGSIATTGTATAYNTSSDQRLKDNIVDAPSASDDIDAIQVRSFDWKADGSHQKYGMVAQELHTVAPDAVTIPDDPEEMAGVDYSKLVPMLVKEIQSLRARVAQLEND